MADKTLDPKRHYLAGGRIYGEGGKQFGKLEDLAKERGFAVGEAQEAEAVRPVDTARVGADGRLQQTSGASTEPQGAAFDPFDPEATPLRALELALVDLDEEAVRAAQERDTRAGAKAIYSERLGEG